MNAVATYVDVAGFLFNLVKEDVQSNQRDQNLTTALDCMFKCFERRDGGRRRPSQQVEII